MIKLSEGVSVSLQLPKESLKDHQKEFEVYQRKIQSLERQLNEVIATKLVLTHNNEELRAKISDLAFQSKQKDDSHTALEKQLKIDIVKFQEEKEDLADRLRETEQRLSQEILDLVDQKTRLEAEKIECFDCIAEFDYKLDRKNKFIVY